MLKYSQYKYERIDLDTFKKKSKNILKQFNSVNSVEEQINLIKDLEKIIAEWSTYASIASLEYSRNTFSEKNKQENEYYDNIDPDLKEISIQYADALLQSPFRKKLEAKYGDHIFNLKEVEKKTFDSKIKDLLRKESDLCNKYSELIASAKINFDGETYNLTGLGLFHTDPSRQIRKKSYEARFKFFEQNSNKLDKIYDDLIKVRTKIAHKLGYENYVELGYNKLSRTDYDSDDVANYRKQIVDYVVPIATKLHNQRKKILNLDNLYFYDSINFKEGDPKPKGTLKHLVSEAQKMYKELSTETGVFFDMMVNEELMDLENRKGKRGGGFCTAFPMYERPFIFANFNGTDHDVTVLTHEAGHAFQVFSSRMQPLQEYHWPTLEACEIHSMSMEFITWPWMDKFFKEETDRFKYLHMAKSLSFLPYGACVDHFQHWVYENYNASPKERKEQWLKLEKIYLPDRDYDDLNYPKQGGIWQGQLHIYQMPFYYIDYTLAQTCAFQFWMKFNRDKKIAWEEYYRLCRKGGSLPFTKLLDVANLKSPFEDGTLKEVIQEISNWLDGIDPNTLN
ncbi:MAG: oligoendopeptidase F [Candidatus Marinimicrobia bacterium]|nr:oligoendopeptidase F [Candidatus Neomarinimicrobiota bacterium]